MKIVSPMLVVLAVAVTGCSAGIGGKSSASPTGAAILTPADDETPTPASKPVSTPTGGTGWRYAYISEQTNTSLRDVTAAGPREAWAVGNVAEKKLLLMHYDGSRWRQADPPPEVADLTEEHTAHIAASAADNVWLVQTRKSPGSLTFRWNGSRWQKIPHELGTDEQISDLEVFGPDDVWAVDGGRFARHWDGRSWNKVPLPADADALGGTGPDDVWAVGYRDSGPGIHGDDMFVQPAAMHWDGRSWRLVPTPIYEFTQTVTEGGAALEAVIALSPDDVWAAGSQGYDPSESPEQPDTPAVLMHWDGRRWTERPGPKLSGCCAELGASRSGVFLAASKDSGREGTWRVDVANGLARVPEVPRIPGLWEFRVRAMSLSQGSETVWAVGRVGNDISDTRAVIARYP